MGSLLGYVRLDAIAAIVVGLMIIKMGLSYGWNSVKELIDTAIDPKGLAEVERVIRDINGVKKIHQLRSRTMGNDIIIDVHVQVDPFISVSEGHYIAQHVHYVLIKQLPKVKDVTVHIDPEDDEICCPSMQLPNRNQLEKDLLLKWKKAYPSIDSWSLHYLDGQLIIDLFYDSPIVHTQPLLDTINQDLTGLTIIKEVRLYSQIGFIKLGSLDNSLE